MTEEQGKSDDEIFADKIDERILLAHQRTVLANERNKLANERTFLAWTRTGLAIVGGGVAIIRLLTFENPNHQKVAQLIGAVLIVLGIIMFFLSFIDYSNSYKKLKVKDAYAGSIWSIALIAFILTIISIMLLVITVNNL